MSEYDYLYDWKNRKNENSSGDFFNNLVDRGLHKQIFGDKTVDLNMLREQVTRYLDEMVKENTTISDYEITSTEVDDSKIIFTLSYQKV